MPVRSRPSTQAATVAAAPGALPIKGHPAAPRDVRLREQAPEVQYARALHRHLAGMPHREIDFFVNPRRVALMDRLIGEELRTPGLDILNVACGPFAVEFYMKLTEARIESFDREERLAGLHKELVGRGLIGSSVFTVADVAKFKSTTLYDVVLINDLFYSRYIDFYALLPVYAARVKPGGLLYFDIQDERAGPLWRAFGKDGQFRRYQLDDVARGLRDSGFEIEAKEPALGIKGGVDGAIRRTMWRVASLANSYVFVARKRIA